MPSLSLFTVVGLFCLCCAFQFSGAKTIYIAPVGAGAKDGTSAANAATYYAAANAVSGDVVKALDGTYDIQSDSFVLASGVSFTADSGVVTVQCDGSPSSCGFVLMGNNDLSSVTTFKCATGIWVKGSSTRISTVTFEAHQSTDTAILLEAVANVNISSVQALNFGNGVTQQQSTATNIRVDQSTFSADPNALLSYGIDISGGQITNTKVTGFSNNLKLAGNTNVSNFESVKGPIVLYAGSYWMNNINAHDTKQVALSNAGPGVSLVLSHSVFTNNANADGPGCILFEEQTNPITLSSVSFDGCTSTAGLYGGAISLSFVSSFTIDSCNFTNSATSGNEADGGAIKIGQSSSVTITNSRFTKNTADRHGGDIVIFSGTSKTAPISISNCTFTNSTATGGSGGSISVWNQPLNGQTNTQLINIAGSVISGAVAQMSGGGIYLTNSVVNITSTTIMGCKASLGGGVRSEAMVMPNFILNITMRSVTLIGNSASSGGASARLEGNIDLTDVQSNQNTQTVQEYPFNIAISDGADSQFSSVIRGGSFLDGLVVRAQQPVSISDSRIVGATIDPRGLVTMINVQLDSSTPMAFCCAATSGGNLSVVTGFQNQFCNYPTYTVCGQVGCANVLECNGNGTCNIDNVCICKANHFGANCEKFCDSNTCQNGGRCAGDGTCNCNGNYNKATQCTTCVKGFDVNANCVGCVKDHYWGDCHFCNSTTCNGHGSCTANNSVNSYFCQCQNDGLNPASNCATCKSGRFNYPACDVTCDPLTTCNDMGDCNGNGTCTCFNTRYDGASNCTTCIPGFYGYPGCDTVCDSVKKCNNHGQCNGDGFCMCALGYNPIDSCASCAGGYSGYPNCTINSPAATVTIGITISGNTTGTVGIATIGGSTTANPGNITGASVTVGIATTGNTTAGATIGIATTGNATGATVSSSSTGASTPRPTSTPSAAPTSAPSAGPTSAPSAAPTSVPSAGPTPAPTAAPPTLTVTVTVTLSMSGDPAAFNISAFKAGFAASSGVNAANIEVRIIFLNATKRASQAFRVEIVAKQTVLLSEANTTAASSLSAFNATTLTAKVQTALADPTSPLGQTLTTYTVSPNVTAQTTTEVYTPTLPPTQPPKNTAAPTSTPAPAPSASTTTVLNSDAPRVSSSYFSFFVLAVVSAVAVFM